MYVFEVCFFHLAGFLDIGFECFAHFGSPVDMFVMISKHFFHLQVLLGSRCANNVRKCLDLGTNGHPRWALVRIMQDFGAIPGEKGIPK